MDPEAPEPPASPGGRETPDAAMLNGVFAAAGVAPRAVMRRLVW